MILVNLSDKRHHSENFLQKQLNMVAKDNIQKVLDSNCCIGCGACAYVSKCQMKLNKFGEYIPDIKQDRKSALKNEVASTKAYPFYLLLN